MKNARDLKHDTDLIIIQMEEKPYEVFLIPNEGYFVDWLSAK